MAVPKRRISTYRQGKRRAAIGLGLPSLVACPNCQELRPPHQECSACGQYKIKNEKRERSQAPEAKSRR